MPVHAEDNDLSSQSKDTKETNKITEILSRFTVGGYGEAVYSYNFYSDKYTRYLYPENYKNETHGRFDLPHVVIYLGYDFGKGWTMGSEIEFEHGGTESAIEIEEEEAGEDSTLRSSSGIRRVGLTPPRLIAWE